MKTRRKFQDLVTTLNTLKHEYTKEEERMKLSSAYELMGVSSIKNLRVFIADFKCSSTCFHDDGRDGPTSNLLYH